ncbi:MAG: hypothetical protein K2X27_24625 [Candidatus Obscuribacterales bacterium]|nr:hypothetical protein [Candidatus Obscuribacterales bacterium]
MASKDIPFIDMIKDSWPLFQRQPLLCTGVSAILLYVPFLVVAIPVCIVAFLSVVAVALINKDLAKLTVVPVGIIGLLVFAYAYNYVRAGWIYIVLRLLRNKSASFNELKDGYRWSTNLFITGLIMGVGTTLLALCFLLPGAFFAVRTALAPYLVVDEDLGPIEALKKSNELVSGYSWQIFAFLVILGFCNFVLGSIPFLHLIALPVSMGFFDLALGRIYQYRQGEELESFD